MLVCCRGGYQCTILVPTIADVLDKKTFNRVQERKTNPFPTLRHALHSHILLHASPVVGNGPLSVRPLHLILHQPPGLILTRNCVSCINMLRHAMNARPNPTKLETHRYRDKPGLEHSILPLLFQPLAESKASG